MIKKTPKPEAFENTQKPDRDSLLRKYNSFNNKYNSYIRNSQAQKNDSAPNQTNNRSNENGN